MPNVPNVGWEAGFSGMTVTDDYNVYAYALSNPGQPQQTFFVHDRLVSNPSLVRFDSIGQVTWARPVSGWGQHMDSEGSNAIYVAGFFSGTQDFDGNPLTAQGTDAFLARYDAQGNVVWVRQMGGPGDENTWGVSVDGLGNIHVAGDFSGNSITLGGTTLTATHDSTTGYLATYDPSGNLQWAVRTGGSDNPLVVNLISRYQARVHSDASGVTYVYGLFSGTGDFGGISLSTTGSDDYFLARFNSDGSCPWVKRFGSLASKSLMGDVGTNGDGIFVSGSFQGVLDIDGSLFSANGGLGRFLAFIDNTGDHQWTESLASAQSNDDLLGSVGDVTITTAGDAWVGFSYDCLSGCPVGPYILQTNVGVPTKHAIARFDDLGNCLDVDSLVGGGAVGGGSPFIAVMPNDELCLKNGQPVNVQGGFAITSDPPTVLGPDPAETGMSVIARFDGQRDLRWYRPALTHETALDEVNALALSQAGGSVSAGHFDGISLHCADTLRSHIRNGSVFVSRRDANGDCLWTRAITSRNALSPLHETGTTRVIGLALTSNDEVYLAGSHADSLDLGGIVQASAGETDGYLAKLDAGGSPIWLRTLSGTGAELLARPHVAPNGDVAVVGTFTGSIAVGGNTFTSAGTTDGLLLRYDANGNLLWARSFGGPNVDLPSDIGFDANGNVYLLGQFRATAEFDGTMVTGTGGLVADIFLAKYDAGGTVQWVKAYTGAGYKAGSAIVTNADGSSYITGSFTQDVDFGNIALTGANFNYRSFLAGLDPMGNDLWAQQFQTSGSSQGNALVRRPGGDLVMGGSFTGTVSFGGDSFTSAGYSEMFVAAFDESGTPLWATASLSNSTGSSQTLALAADWNVVLAGGSFGSAGYGLVFFPDTCTTDLDPNGAAGLHVASNAQDPFIVAFAIPQSTSIADAESPALSIAPNPVRDQLIISGLMVESDASLQVMDMSGRVLKTQFVNANGSMILGVAELAAGSYLVRSNAGRVARFVKQ